MGNLSKRKGLQEKTMKKVEVSFDIGDSVEIPELERKGRVSSIFITASGVQYQVRYFNNSELKEVYFFREELKALP